MFLSEIFNLGNNSIQILGLNIPIDQLINIGYKCIKIFLILIMMVLSIKIGNKIINKWAEKQWKIKYSLNPGMSKTIAAILSSILKYFVYFVGIVAIITEFFNTISFTFAGIGGIALGFGAQSFIKDIVNGFLILFEGQYTVGEQIEIDTKSGVVESIELRITRIRDANGALHIIPNGTIIRVTNHSRGPKRILVDINIGNNENIDNVIDIINTVCCNFSKDNEDIEEKPEVIGVTEIGLNGIILRVVGKVKHSRQAQSETELRKRIKIEMDNKGIEIPYSKFKMLN